MQHLQPNTLLQGGKYKIENVLGQGGFGITYLASQSVSIESPLGRINAEIKVTIKEFFMKDSCNRDEVTNCVIVATKAKEELVTRMKNKFMKEACALQNMSHPNIVHVENAFEENATAYYVMDYIEGTSLNDIIKVAGSLSESKALDYIKQIAEALKYVHSRNILHLDVKPGNIMIDRSEKAILIDFGASKQYDEVSGENTSTLLGINTTGFAPAEQSYRGFIQFAPSTDIYALGATLYKLLTGITPPDAQMLKDGEAELIPLPSDISISVKNAVKESMRPLRKDRPQSIDEFIALLGKTFGTSSQKNFSKKNKKKDLANEETIAVSPYRFDYPISKRINKRIIKQYWEYNIVSICLDRDKTTLNIDMKVYGYPINVFYNEQYCLKTNTRKKLMIRKCNLPNHLDEDFVLDAWSTYRIVEEFPPIPRDVTSFDICCEDVQLKGIRIENGIIKL